MKVEDVFSRFFSQVVDYLPSLAAGLLLVLLGAAAAWFVKRAIVQLLVIMRVHRLLGGMRWARGLQRVDVRLSLYGIAGNTIAFLVFLVFLNAAFSALKLTMVSNLIEETVFIFPRLLLASGIFVAGWFLSTWAGHNIRRSLLREAFPRAGFIASYVKAALLLLFAAMALAELNISREIVIIGFTVIYITLGTLTVILALFAGRGFLRQMIKASEGEKG